MSVATKAKHSREDVVWMPDVLVLGPGGIKGFAILGSIHHLGEIGMLTRIETFIGVSVGAIISLFIAVGMTHQEILELATTTDIMKIGGMSSIQGIKDNIGLISTDAFRKIFVERIKGKLGSVPTLQQLYELTGKSLICVTLNVSKEKTMYISKNSHPNLSCVEAVILSMSIPLLFSKATLDGDLCVDGALGDSYPVPHLDDGKHNILGIRIHTTFASPLGIETYPSAILDAHLWVSSQQHIEKCSSKCKHITIDVPYANVVGISVTVEEKLKMFQRGIEECSKLGKEVGWSNGK